MVRRYRHNFRPVEALLLLVALLVMALGLASVAAAGALQAGQNPAPALLPALLPLLPAAAAFLAIHLLLSWRQPSTDQLILPLAALIFAIGLVMIFRLRGEDGVWQQIWRGFVPGMLIAGVLIYRPTLIEYLRRWAVPVSLAGLLLIFLTAFFGVVDESGARLALKLGPLPAIQTTEVLKIVLVIFLAWYIEREGAEVEGRATTVLGFVRVPKLHYFVPGLLFVGLAALALVKMSDFGAVLILGGLFVGMLYAGFEGRIFGTVAAIGLALALLLGAVLYLTWDVPDVIEYRFLAFRNPWSQAEILRDGQPTGVTISAGPGYQVQQSVYAVIAGGVSGAGLGFGSPEFVPLSFSDFIFPAIIEELGALTGLALLALYTILILRILRLALLLPHGLIFERLLLVGIAIHFFIQTFVMTAGALNLIPLTGVTVPLLSLGGMAVLVNLAEVGIALALASRTRLVIYEDDLQLLPRS